VKAKKLYPALPPVILQLVQALDKDPDQELITLVNELLGQRSCAIGQEPAAFLDTLFLKAISDRFGPSHDSYRDRRQSGHLYLAQ
jgi:hypothetical protein